MVVKLDINKGTRSDLDVGGTPLTVASDNPGVRDMLARDRHCANWTLACNVGRTNGTGAGF